MLDLSLGFGLCICALLAALTLSRRPLAETDVNLAGWLVSYALFFVGWAGAARLPGGPGYALAALASSAIMLTPVFLWFYVRAAAGDRVRFRWPHFIPALINLALMIALALFARAENIGGAIAVTATRALAPLAFAPVALLSAVSVYPILAYKRAAPREADLKNALSDETALAFNWVRVWSATTIALNLALIVVSLASNAGGAPLEAITTIGATIIAAQILYVAYKGLHSGAIAKTDAPVSIAPPGASADGEPVRLEAFEAHMAGVKPFLKPDLTIGALADQLGWPREEVTRAVRVNDENFFDCINRYRVEEARRLIADPANADITLLSLAYDAGFGSKSTFNAAFRRRFGMSPSKFRAQALRANPLK
ncbi:MAG: helix-turn-helix transcriptional regulator [Parvularculaceae bacterium]|nr:helix-turn-helix transcriptional regulator [Parvularculaceae bacterium]